jgi:acetyl-CoA synthetase
MVAAWLPMAADHIGLTLIIVDYPVTDAADWECATNAALEVRRLTGRPIAMVATLPELLPLEVAERLAAGGVVPMNGLSEAIIAAELAAKTQVPVADVPLSGGTIEQEAKLLNEHSAKAALTTFGISVPNSGLADDAAQVEQVAQTLKPPLVLKAVGVAHKSDSGGVVLNVTSQTIGVAAVEMQSQAFLIEEMVVGGIVELLVGVTRDPAHGFVLTLGAGGVLTELWQDTQSLLVPSEPPVIRAALRRLRIWPLLEGYRGKQGADLDSIIAAIKGVQDYVIAHADSLTEVEINPLICTADAAIAADALIYKT